MKGVDNRIGVDGLVPVKDRNGTTIRDKEKFKERCVEHFENVLNRRYSCRKRYR